MYYFQLDTKGYIEKFTTLNVTKLFNKTVEIVKETTILDGELKLPKGFKSVSSAQRTLRKLKYNERIELYIQNTRVDITKTKNL